MPYYFRVGRHWEPPYSSDHSLLCMRLPFLLACPSWWIQSHIIKRLLEVTQKPPVTIILIIPLYAPQMHWKHIDPLSDRIVPRKDGISGEILKYGGRSPRRLLHKLTVSAWKAARIPHEWKYAKLTTPFKTGDRSEYGNYRSRLYFILLSSWDYSKE